MRFWKRASYQELMYDAEEHHDITTSTSPPENAANGKTMLSRSSSACSSSGISACLAQDPTREAKVGASSRSTSTGVSFTKSINAVALDSLDIGDYTIDDDGVEWVVRQCFCGSTECPGKTFKRLDGKDELDVWDRGRPVA